MAFIEIGIRHNLLYPFLFMISINILRIIKIIVQEINDTSKLNYIYSLLRFISTIICSLIFLYLGNKTNKIKRNSRIMGIELIQDQYGIEDIKKRVDHPIIIVFLICLDAYFDLIGSIRKEYLIRLKPFDTKLLPLDIRIRSREIIFASLSSYFFLRTKLNKHHIFSLIMISLFSLSLYIFEVTFQFKHDYYSKISDFIKLQVLKVVINMSKVLSDIIEKYLFEFNSVEPFKLLFIKGLAQSLYIGFFYIFKTNNEFSNLFKNDKNKSLHIFFFIILIIIYFILSGFYSIYKTFTVKIYSSMTRTLFDSILDIGFYLYFSIGEDENKNIKTFYFWFNFIGQFIKIFFNLVYNEFLVLNVCGLEKETYKEIAKRARASSVELINDSISENIENNDANDIFNTTL